MTRPSNILRSVAAVSLIVTMFAALSVTGSAQVVVNPDTFPDFFTSDVNECYFASVSNGEDFGLGASQTSITIQNLDDESGVAYIMVGTGDGFDDAEFTNLNPGASKTFTGADLGVPEGTTVPVVVAGYDFASSQAGEFTPEDGIVLGCVAKQAVAGESLPYTTAADTSVSGYNATSGREVGFFDQLYLPIVQTNCGPGGCWNSVLRIANVGPFDNAAVTVRFFPAENAGGSLDTGFQLEGLLDQGELWSIDLSAWVDPGWVGSAHILTDDNVVATVDRYKAGTDMWITNTAANATAESELQVPGAPANAPYVLYAPDVRLDFNGWNTGISVANTVDMDNNVNIQYFGNNGNAPQAQSQRLAAHGMTYFYNPSDPSEDECEQPADQVPTCDFVGAAIIVSEQPVASAVDGVKYFGNDANVGQAFSYTATGNVHNWQAAPLVQKGSPATGMGATSGITFLNPNAGATFITVDWVNPSGFGASNFGDSIVWVPGYSTGFVYTMFQENLPNGFSGSAIVASDLPIAATTVNVDYQVQGDGTAIWNLYNPCGLYRQLGDCPFVVEPEELATKTFDIRPAGADALICVFDSVTGQDGKPIAPDAECVLEAVGEKGDGGGGQDELATFFATTDDDDGEVFISLTFDEDSNEVDADVIGMDETDLTVTLLNYTITDEAGNVSASGENATCDTITAGDPNVNETVIDGGALTGPELTRLGDFEDAVVVVTDAEGNELFCGQVESGTVRLETPEEAQERLGTVVPPFTTDAAGRASIDLAAGCYFFVVSAEGFETFISIEECLEPGETVNNIIDLEPIVGPGPVEEGSLTKTFVDSAGNPVDELLVTIEEVDETGVGTGEITIVGPVDDAGVIVIDPINFGTYELCWTDISDPTDLDQFIDGCEIVSVPDEEGNEDVVVLNTLEAFAVLDVCVRDEESDAALAGATVIAIVDGEIVATGVTDASGEAELLVNAGVDTDGDGVDDGGTLIEVSASADGFTTSEGAVTILSEDPDEECGAEDITEIDPETGEEVVVGTALTQGTADILLGLDSIEGQQVITALKTVEFDGVAQEGLYVEFYSVEDGVTVCDPNDPAFVGTLEDFGFTDENGEVELTDTTNIPAPTGFDYCVVVYATDELGLATQVLATDSLDLSGTVGVVTVTNELSDVAGFLDVVVDPDDSGVGIDEFFAYTVAVYEAEPGVDDEFGCGGTTLVAQGISLDPEDASFSFLLAAGDYCVDAQAIAIIDVGGTPQPINFFGSETGTLPAGDPADDVDIVVEVGLFI